MIFDIIYKATWTSRNLFTVEIMTEQWTVLVVRYYLSGSKNNVLWACVLELFSCVRIKGSNISFTSSMDRAMTLSSWKHIELGTNFHMAFTNQFTITLQIWRPFIALMIWSLVSLGAFLDAQSVTFSVGWKLQMFDKGFISTSKEVQHGANCLNLTYPLSHEFSGTLVLIINMEKVVYLTTGCLTPQNNRYMTI